MAVYSWVKGCIVFLLPFLFEFIPFFLQSLVAGVIFLCVSWPFCGLFSHGFHYLISSDNNLRGPFHVSNKLAIWNLRSAQALSLVQYSVSLARLSVVHIVSRHLPWLTFSSRLGYVMLELLFDHSAPYKGSISFRQSRIFTSYLWQVAEFFIIEMY